MRVRLSLDDDPSRLGPRLGLIFERGKQPLGLARSFVLSHGREFRLARALSTGFSPNPSVYWMPSRSQPSYMAGMAIPESPRSSIITSGHFARTRAASTSGRHRPPAGMGRAVQQTRHHDLVVLRAGDQPRLVLILFIVAVKERQLLLAVRRIVERVDVERQRRGGWSNEAKNCSTNTSRSRHKDAT